MHLNDRARAIAEHLMAEAGQLGVEVQRSADGVRIVDCGVKKPGGNEAGILLARAAMAAPPERVVRLSPARVSPPC